MEALVEIEEDEAQMFKMRDESHENVTFVNSIMPRRNVTCGTHSCYELSKYEKKVCRFMFDKSRSPFLVEFSEKLGSKSILYLIILAIYMISTITSYIIHYSLTNEEFSQTNEGKVNDYLH